ncbi:MAG: M6 family metalloprotease domain-containing protein [Bacteroidales bacterium]|nr:M6 family metalloprotease domain-containing protein [Bacteroidales bacterium]
MKNLLFFLFLQIFCLKLLAVPANPEPVTFRLSDGSEVVVHLRGDEFFSWHETVDGYTLLRIENGDFMFAQLNQDGEMIASNFLASNPGGRTPEKLYFLQEIGRNVFAISENLQRAVEVRRIQNENRIQHSSSMPMRTQTTGVRQQMVVLVEFQDIRFLDSYEGTMFTGQELFDSIMNAEDLRINDAMGSVQRYFYDNSHGQLILETTIFGPVTLPRNRAFYGANTGPNGRDAEPRQMIIDALQILDNQGVDFTSFANSENLVEGIHVIFAGCGEENGGCPAEAIWSHKWTITGLVYPNTMTIGGVRFWEYSVSPELAGGEASTMPTHIGVIVHEIAHVLGLPDFYDTDGPESGGRAPGLGPWSAMASGTWNVGGRVPPYLNAFERYLLGWATPIELEIGEFHEKIILPPMDSENSISYVFFARDRQGNRIENERFYIENRNTTRSWDAGIMVQNAVIRGGLMVYHMNSATPDPTNAWTSNRINVNPERENFRIITATAVPGAFESNPFPQGAIDSITDNNMSRFGDPRPNTRSWAGVPSGVPIRNIKIDSTTNIVSFMVGRCESVLQINDTINEGDSVFFANAWLRIPGTYIDTLENILNCDSIVRLVLTVIPNETSIQPVELISELELITIVPNPFSDKIIITNAKVGNTLYVLNLSGVIVHTQRITSQTETIRLGHLPQGVYILRIDELSIRIVKQ